MVFDFPRNGEREYIAAIDITAIVVMAGEGLEICGSRDIEKSFKAAQKSHPSPLQIRGVWWVRNRVVADAVLKSLAREIGRAGGIAAAELEPVIQRLSQHHGSVAVAHALAMDRMRKAGAQIDAALEAANGRGELAWFNRAYRAYREAGGRLAYQAARARLRRAVVRRLVITGGIEFGADLLPEVLGEGR